MGAKGNRNCGRKAATIPVSPSLQGQATFDRLTPRSGGLAPLPSSETDIRDKRTRRGEGKVLKTIRFTIGAPLFGYRQTTKWTIWHPKERERSSKYGKYKWRVWLLALEVGFRGTGFTDINNAPRLSVAVFWKKTPRIDWKNVYGAVEDSLWCHSDRYVRPGQRSDVFWNSGIEKAEVIVEIPRC